MILVDILENEFKVGDFVVNATSCFGKGHLRKALVKTSGIYQHEWKTHPYNDKPFIALKSISVGDFNIYKPLLPEKFIKGKKVYIGNRTLFGTNLTNNNNKFDIFQFEVLRIGSSPEDIFNSTELEFIKTTKTKLK